MSGSLIACIVLLVFFIAVGVTAIALVCCSGRASRANGGAVAAPVGQRWSAEVLWLHEMFPEAELLGLEPDAQGDIVAPPVVPGRGGEGGN